MLRAHASLAWMAAAAAIAALVAAVALVAGVRGARLWLDRAILGVVVMVLFAAVAGLVLAIGGHPLADPLHAVYGIVALVTLPIARYAGRTGGRRTAWYSLVGAGFVLAVMLRLFMTG